MSNYIGRKGYSVKKTNISLDFMNEIRNELNVKPNTGINGYISSVSYPIYRESQNKMYLPRYYGIDKFGPCDNIKISYGTDVDLNFNGNLFEYQKNIINKYLKHIGKCGGGLLDVEPGNGKTVMALNIISK